MSKFIPKVVNGTLPEIQDGSMIFDKEAKKIYFDFDGQHQEVKSGEEYQQGTGIKIDNNVISVNETVAKSADLTSEVTTARAAEEVLQTGKQDKLPNATQIGQVLKATNTEGGIAWGEADGSLVINGTIEFDEEPRVIVSDEESTKLINAINAGKRDCLLNISFMPGNNGDAVSYIFKQTGIIPEDDSIDVIFDALSNIELLSINFNYKVDLTEKAWTMEETFIQEKLPDAPAAGKVLKSTNEYGGVEWGEAGSGLPSTDNAKTGDALKVQITPAVYKFTTSIAESETPQDFFINTLSDFDFSGITYDEVDDEGNPIKTILKFNGSLFRNSNDDDDIWGIVASSSFGMFPGIHGLYIAEYDPDEGFSVQVPLYLPVDAINAWGYGDWTKGWLFDQTDGEMASYAQAIKTIFPLDSSIPGNTSIYKAAQNICKKVLSVIAGKDIRSSFSSANTVEKVSDATTSFKWESALPTGQNDFGQFYASQFYKQTNLSELKDTCRGVGLDLTKVPDFSYFDTLPLETGEQMLVYTYSGYSVEGIEGQGLFLYVSTVGETNTYALGLTLALDDSASTAEDFIHFPLYATSACEFDHQFKASSGSTEVFNYHYSFSGAGWAQTESWIGSEADSFRINPVGDISSLWNTALNFGQCISFEQLGSGGMLFIFYPGLDFGNKFMSFKTLGSRLNSLPGDVSRGYVYTDSSSGTPDICTIGYNYDTDETTSYEITVPILPDIDDSWMQGIPANSILLYDNSSTKTINNVEYRRKYKWLNAPSGSSNNKVLTYNYSTSSVEWADGGSSGGGAAKVPTYNESAINYETGYGFNLEDLATDATYACYFSSANYTGTFTLYTDSTGSVLHDQSILAPGYDYASTPKTGKLELNSSNYANIKAYNDSAWDVVSGEGSTLYIKRLL